MSGSPTPMSQDWVKLNWATAIGLSDSIIKGGFRLFAPFISAKTVLNSPLLSMIGFDPLVKTVVLSSLAITL